MMQSECQLTMIKHELAQMEMKYFSSIQKALRPGVRAYRFQLSRLLRTVVI